MNKTVKNTIEESRSLSVYIKTNMNIADKPNKGIKLVLLGLLGSSLRNMLRGEIFINLRRLG